MAIFFSIESFFYNSQTCCSFEIEEMKAMFLLFILLGIVLENCLGSMYWSINEKEPKSRGKLKE